MSWSLLGVEEEQIEHLDFDVRCGADHCERTATWWQVCLECALHTPSCDGHRRWYSEEAPRASLCACICGAMVPGPLWTSLFTFVPIGTP